ncbi:hypothetical protein Phum_PHUM565800 [Pediculus humanus corporis]|uniref:Uncharacterized protein n=1 Tax=Pediculus humanus subsp. corporis TaxID=121224 RepID=E0W0Z0_PEDHC|nr:uncharacterized protein Phum_PHUM565800 [Pediculus humanus corporis]EEB19295.1 hypothetical protein Phum_PHUM565800 [Pediculus humanus corporis]
MIGLYGLWDNESLFAETIDEEEKIQKNYWSDVDKTDNSWTDDNMYKYHKDNNWIQEDNESSLQNTRLYRNRNRNYWQGTPESVSSDDGNRLRWGDRGIGIGHLWEPVVNRPDCRLPLVNDHYRPAPKWVEKGLKNYDGSTKAEVLIISHPDDEYKPQKNYILGQNAPIPLDVMEEQAIELAEKRAREDKKRSKRHAVENNAEKKNISVNSDKVKKLEKVMQPTDAVLNLNDVNDSNGGKEQEKILKDSSSQFEDIQLANSFQLLNMNGLPVDGGLALMLDNTTTQDNGFLLPPDGVQLALLMSPRNTSTTTNRVISLTPSVSESVQTEEKTLTPSKYRISQRLKYTPSNKSTQTDFGRLSIWPGSAGKRRRLSMRCGGKTGNGTNSKVINLDRHKQGRYFIPTKYRSKGPRMSLEDRPKWGINRPAIEYKKQSEKDPYYQKRLKQRLKNIGRDATSSSDQTIKNEDVTKNDEKELQSVARLLELPIEMRNNTEEEEEEEGRKTEIILRNGFRMNSNLSSPVFVPIDNRIKSTDFKFDKSNKYAVESEKIFQRRIVKREMITDEEVEEEDTTEVENEKISDSDTGNFLNDLQLEAIQKITDLREKDYSNSRSTTPFSEKSVEK